MIVVTEDWAPYNYVEEGELKGFPVEIVHAIMRELDQVYDIKIVPGARGEIMLEKFSNVINFSLFRTPEREARFQWIGPIANDEVFFYKRANDQRIFNNIDDVREVELVATRHYGLIKSYAEGLGLENLSKTPNVEGQFKHLLLGEADLLVNSSPIGTSYYLKQLGIPRSKIRRTNVKLLDFPLYIAASKEIPNFIIDLWQGKLEEIKNSGEYDQIYLKYLGTSTK
ncbi:substrate-binding periplasmic protein [Curvivirga aplysinae]|uniref:substrate-binding periplasmic protein n=1 Tax=Curvivirga aplysinae TaxID=2529852 RepID=UPI001C3F5FF3|nr:transporter substrate-binding domain-containing protein [Curvivirga aplysinae]